MDYHGTNQDDHLSQSELNLPAGSNIYGGAGNDIIMVGVGVAFGEAGNDTLIGTTPFSVAAYVNSPGGVTVNLAQGKASDGFGGQDTLTNIYIVQDSLFSDTLIGSTGSDSFFLSLGNDTVIGGGGNDNVVYAGYLSTKAQISYNAATDTFTVQRPITSNLTSVSTLRNINAISFVGPGSDNVTYTKDMFVADNGFLRKPMLLAADKMDQVVQMRPGDFNGDGKTDFVVTRINFADLGVTASPLQIMIGNGDGTFTDKSEQLFGGAVQTTNYAPRILLADFNQDGVTDIFLPDLGADKVGYPGAKNKLFLSSKATGQLVDASDRIAPGVRQNNGGAIGDVNHDGLPDLLMNALNQNTGHADDLMINGGDGQFVNAQFLLPAVMLSPAYHAGHAWSLLADLNNDGYDDMILGTKFPDDKPTQVVLNDGHGSFVAAVPINLPRSGVPSEMVTSIDRIDLNGDALPDLLISTTVSVGDNPNLPRIPYLQFLINQDEGRFTDVTELIAPQNRTSDSSMSASFFLAANVTDINHDGHDDIVVEGNGMPPAILLNTGEGKFVVGWQGRQGTRITTSDIDGDGMDDLIEAGSNGYSVLTNVLANQHIYKAKFGGETILASRSNDMIYANAGGNTIDGGGGTDTLVLGGTRAAHALLYTAKGLEIKKTGSPAFSDVVRNVELLKFDDGTVDITYHKTVQELYVAYFGRPADSGALVNFSARLAEYGVAPDIQRLNAAYGGDARVRALIDSFGSSPESNALYAGASTTAFVDSVYRYMVNRTPDIEGQKFWVNAIDHGGLSRANAALSMMAAALVNDTAQGKLDAALILGKIGVASNFTYAIDTPAEVKGYVGNGAAAAARAMLWRVSGDTDLAQFQATVEETLAKMAGAQPAGFAADDGAAHQIGLVGVPDPMAF